MQSKTALRGRVPRHNSLVRQSGIQLTDHVNKVVDGYRIRRKVGSGGTAHVFEAWKDDKKVALKIATEGEKNRFIVNERDMLQINVGKKAPKLLDGGEFEGKQFLITDFIDGNPLSEVIGMVSFLDWHFARKIVMDLCDSLFMVHQSGVVHRDIKPSNIILRGWSPFTATVDYKNLEVNLVDFGISRRIEDCGKLDNEDVFEGTPSYVSPEMAAGNAHDFRSDIYSVGVLMYELLSGYLPIHAESISEMLTRHVFEIPQPPSKISESIVEADPIIMKCLEKNPENRFANVLALREQVEALLSGSRRPPSIIPARKASPDDDTIVDRKAG